MPRHPPNALLTLDHSHCQCPSLFDRPGKPCGKPVQSCQPPKRKAPNGPDPCKGASRSKNQSYLLQLRSYQMSSTCSDPAYPMNAPALIKHGSLRPASRDLSGDARSGNANQIAQRLKQASNIQRPFPTGFRIYLQTLIQSQAG
jgi:hypothetical protein